MSVRSASIVTVTILFLTVLFASACSAPTDPVKSERTIAEEIYDCLDSDEREGIAFLWGKEWYITYLVDAKTKAELIEEREEECRGD